jgi:hypothetical protein
MEPNLEPKSEARSLPLGFNFISDMGMSTAMHMPGFVGTVVLSLPANPSGVTAAPLRTSPGSVFNKPDMRMKISVGAMPCVIGVSGSQQFSLQVTDTHVCLQGNPH